MKTARDYLTEIYNAWRFNYNSVYTFAVHNGITTEQAQDLIELARTVINSDHPDM